jgi:hypothetical protein
VLAFFNLCFANMAFHGFHLALSVNRYCRTKFFSPLMPTLWAFSLCSELFSQHSTPYTLPLFKVLEAAALALEAQHSHLALYEQPGASASRTTFQSSLKWSCCHALTYLFLASFSLRPL